MRGSARAGIVIQIAIGLALLASGADALGSVRARATARAATGASTDAMRGATAGATVGAVAAATPAAKSATAAMIGPAFGPATAGSAEAPRPASTPALLTSTVPAHPIATGPARGEAEDAYRRGDHATALELWRSELPAATSAAERARLCYNCGNAAFRMDDLLEAVGWYTAGLRHAPRDENLWYNLELARAEAGLEPADRGDLEATSHRVLGAMTLVEADWLVAASLLVLALALFGEALRGGFWKRLAWLAVALVCVASVPWLYGRWQARDREVLVVADGKVSGRSEPRPDAKRLSELSPGEILPALDALPGWIKVDVPSVGELWVPDKNLFALER